VRTDDFDFDLPPELVARHPSERRDDARMLVLDRASGTWEHRRFRDLPALLPPEALAVLNDTRVVPARFVSPDGKIEVLRLEAEPDDTWRCLVRPGKRFRTPGDTVTVAGSRATVVEVLPDGSRRLRFDPPLDSRAGQLALPPYLGRAEEEIDRERYQTVFASRPGAIAAPTAGLHFTPEILARVPHAFVTLHVGAGTFLPVKAERVEDHRMHEEHFLVSEPAAAAIRSARSVLAVGTTVVRVLEHLAASGGVRAGEGSTAIFIRPPHQFLRVDALLTNFHLPKSTLLMLVSAFAGRDLVLAAYRDAVRERYRFFSYGDCMLLR
jgi:S-adenosylmethionine:tRNA ribosyltransferase-isomerase